MDQLNFSPPVLFVGANRSKQGHSRLMGWLTQLEVYDYKLQPSATPEVIKWKGPIVALGVEAHEELIRLEKPHYHMLSPSGRNRALSIKWAFSSRLEGLRQYLSNWSIE